MDFDLPVISGWDTSSEDTEPTSASETQYSLSSLHNEEECWPEPLLESPTRHTSPHSLDRISLGRNASTQPYGTISTPHQQECRAIPRIPTSYQRAVNFWEVPFVAMAHVQEILSEYTGYSPPLPYFLVLADASIPHAESDIKDQAQRRKKTYRMSIPRFHGALLTVLTYDASAALDAVSLLIPQHDSPSSLISCLAARFNFHCRHGESWLKPEVEAAVRSEAARYAARHADAPGTVLVSDVKGYEKWLLLLRKAILEDFEALN